MNWSLPALAIRRPITTVMCVITVTALGVISYTRIPLEFLSGAEFPILSCFIPYPGAAPEQVEREVAVPAEGMFLTVPRIKKIRSWSENDGCFVFMEFEWETDMSTAAAEIRDRIERLKLELPADVDRAYLRRYDQQNASVLWFGLFGGKEGQGITLDARRYLETSLKRLDGVAEVVVNGGEEDQVYIDFDQNALKARALSLYAVVEILRSSNLNLAVGRLNDGATRQFVRVLDEFRAPGDIAELLIGPNGLRVKDVAKVSLRPPPQDWRFAMDGQKGVFVGVKKESQANTVAVCDAVRRAIDSLKSDPVFGGAQVLVFHDQSEMIRYTLRSLVNAGQYGGILALIVLFVFLRRFRATFLVALAIPASLVVAFVYMFFTGISFNVVTMSSMIVSVGMLVDNSIVVIENIHRHRAFTPDPMRCARDGAAEVALAITTATLTTIVVFIPVIYMRLGELSLYLRQFAAPTCVALVSSLLFALSVVPLAAMRIYRTDPGVRRGVWGVLHRPQGRMAAWHPLQRLQAVYLGFLKFSLRHRLAAFLVLAGLGAATYFVPFSRVGMQQMPTLNTRELDVFVQFERYSKELAEQTFERLTADINALRDELEIQNVYISYGPWGGHVSAFLVRPEDLPLGRKPRYTAEKAKEYLKEHLPERLPGVEIHVDLERSGSQDTQTIMLSLRGDDADEVQRYADDFKQLLRSLPQITDANTGETSDEKEIQLGIDETLAARAGVSPMVLARTVDFALRGARLLYLKRAEREVPVWAQFQESDRRTMENLDNVSVLTPAGELIPLSQLVRVGHGHTPRLLRREQGKSVAGITVEAATKDMEVVRKTIDEALKRFTLPQGYSLGMGMVLEEMEESAKSFSDALSLAVILMYLLMAALFESFLLPLSILTTVPLAFMGVYWSMFITGTKLDTVSMIGGILMCGIIVNNGIVIVDRVNQLRKSGTSRSEAIMQAGHDRLRPVLMTALTTILGCIPIAVGTGSDADMLYSMGRTLVGGLTMGTFLTLFVVPLFYNLFDDLRQWGIDYFGALTLMRAPRSAPGTALEHK